MRLIDGDELKKRLLDYFEYSMELCEDISYFIDNAPTIEPERDTVSRQAVIEINQSYHGQMPNEVNHRIWKEINELPSAQPEPAIPLQWIEAEIKWLKSLDNAFATSKAEDILAMVNIWKEKQDG